MKAFWKWLDEWWMEWWPVVVPLGLLVLVIVGISIGVSYADRAYNERRETCYRAGYDAVEFLDTFSRYGCLVVRDSEYVVVPIETVREELEDR